LIRTSGEYVGAVSDRTDLFTITGKTDGETNLKQGSVLPSDQSMVVLALRVMLWFKNPIQQGPVVAVTTPTSGIGYNQTNGDFQFGAAGSTYTTAQAAIANGSGPASIQDIHRLYWQASEQILWTFGAGQKPSLSSMPSIYFPYGGGLWGDLGGATDLIHWNNGTPDHAGILRLARAILIPPRQNILCQAQIQGLPDGGNGATFGSITTQGRNMLNVRDNLNAADLASKCITFTFDGLFSRDVQ
jgi:hypothetical protein